MSLAIYSIGHSDRAVDSFITLLSTQQINCVVDVRRYPSSRRFPHFNKKNLAISLQDRQIRYVWLGKTLGGMREVEYPEYMDSPIFATGLAELCDYASEYNTAFMCAERLFTACHRKFIADALARQGWSVLHILEDNQLIDHPGTFL